MPKNSNDKIFEPSSDLTQKIDRVKSLPWIIGSAAMVAQLFNMFHRIAVLAPIDRIMADMNITGSVAGNIMAMYFYIYVLMQFPSGMLADFLGARKPITLGKLNPAGPAAMRAPTIITLDTALVTLISGEWRAGVTRQTT